MEWFDVKGFKIIAGVSGEAAFSSNVHFGRYAIYGGINRRFSTNGFLPVSPFAPTA